MFSTRWNEKTVEQKIKTLAIMLVIFFGTLLVAYAVTCYFNASFVINVA